MPMSPALAIERSRLTIVDTAITWSGSVACRIPRKNPMVRMASPLVKQAHLFSEFQGPAHRSISEMEETFRGKWMRRVSLFTKDPHELSGGMREARPAPRNEVDVARHVHLPHFYLLHPTMFDLPMHAHARHDGHTHAHLHEAFDAFDGGHFNGHVERGAVSSKEFDDAAAKGRFHDVGDKILVSQVGDIDFALPREDVLGMHHESQLILEDFGGLKLGVAGHEGNRAQIQAVVEDFVRDVPRKHAVHADLDAGMFFAEFREGGKQGVNGAFVHAEGKLAALQALQFGEPFFHFITEVHQALGVIFEERSRIGEADGASAADEERLAERVLESADRQADGGLSAVKTLPGAGEAALFGHHQKDLKFTKIQELFLRQAV